MCGPYGSWTCAGAVVALFVALLLSPMVAPPNFFDDAIESLIDRVDPEERRVVMPLVDPTTSVSWTEILPARAPFCPPIFKTCSVAHAFAPRPTDVMISTSPKSGTTMLQQITHQLRSKGDMNFSDICDVQPWILLNPLYRGSADDIPQPWTPRIFKNHQSIAEFKGGRHIVTIRDPAKVLVSFYEFGLAKGIPLLRHNGYFHLIAEVLGLPLPLAERWFGSTWKDPSELVHMSLAWRRDMMFGVNFYQYVAEFWLARRDPNVLVLCFEELVRDLSRWIPVIGQFLGVEMTVDLVKKVVDMSSKEFMLKHVSKFDESTIADEINKAGLVHINFEGAPKVRADVKAKALSSDTLSVLRRQWELHVKPSTGFNTYEEMRATWLDEMSHLYPI